MLILNVYEGVHGGPRARLPRAVQEVEESFEPSRCLQSQSASLYARSVQDCRTLCQEGRHTQTHQLQGTFLVLLMFDIYCKK